MKWVFWVSAGVIAYVYIGYPLWLYIRARVWSRPVRRAPIFPSVSIVIAVHNEAKVLPQKLRNLAELHYPADHYEIVIVSDGSTDATNQILAAHANERLRVFVLPDQQGKASALNQAIQAVRGEIVVFTDARQMIERDALRHLVANFADPGVGCVSGELILRESDPGTSLGGVGLYWSIEKKIRYWEGLSGSVVGATGALYAVRKQFLVALPAETILDDVYIPLLVARQGGRVVFEPRARAWDSLAESGRDEFRRKVRTLTGTYQLLQLAPWLLRKENPVRFQFISHRLLRSFVPFFLPGLFLSSWWLAGTVFYRIFAALQLAFYLCAVVGLWLRVKRLGMLLAAPAGFCLLNAAAVVAFVNFLFRRSTPRQLWVSAAPGEAMTAREDR